MPSDFAVMPFKEWD